MATVLENSRERPSVLVVNSLDIRSVIRGLLERERFGPIWEAGDAVTAFVFAREHRPDIVILDSRIPETEASIVVNALRSVAPHAHLVVLVGENQLTPEWANRIQRVELPTLIDALAEIDTRALRSNR